MSRLGPRGHAAVHDAAATDARFRLPAERSGAPTERQDTMFRFDTGFRLTLVAAGLALASLSPAQAQDAMKKPDAMKADTMKADAMKGGAMKTDAMHGDAMAADSMKKNKTIRWHRRRTDWLGRKPSP